MLEAPPQGGSFRLPSLGNARANNRPIAFPRRTRCDVRRRASCKKIIARFPRPAAVHRCMYTYEGSRGERRGDRSIRAAAS